MHNTAADWKMQELANPSSAEDLRASPMKEKRAKRFSPLDLKEQIRAVRRICERLLSQSAHKCRALCPHKESQSAFIPFIVSERMRYESLRPDKRKTARPFFNTGLHQPNPSSARLATSAKREVPRATCNERVSAKFPAQDLLSYSFFAL